MNRYLLKAVLFVSVLLSMAAHSQTSTSIPTKVEKAKFYDKNGDLKDICRGVIGKQFNSYISLSVEKIFVRKEDGALSAVFSSRRTSYPIVKFTAKFAAGDLKINKITEATVISGRKGTADLIGGWSVLDRLPYTFTSPSVQLIIASNSDSNIKNTITMFNNVTSAVPDLQVSTSIAAASAIASAFDAYFLADDRVINAMKTEYDFPLTGGELCEGAYVVFAAKKPSSYAKYVSADLAVNGNVATFKGQPITDISHAIIRLNISNRYYDTPSSALEDTNKKWAAFFNEMATSQTQLFASVTREKIEEFKSSSNSNFILGEEYLRNDPYLLSKEKLEIMDLVKTNYQNKLAVLEQSISAPVVIPTQTAQLITEEANNSFDMPLELKSITEKLDAGQTVTVAKVPPALAPSLRAALNSTSGLIRERVASAAALSEQ